VTLTIDTAEIGLNAPDNSAAVATPRLVQLTSALFATLVLAYLLPGMIGPHPWKPDEPYYFGMAYGMLRDGHWLVPTVAGEPFIEKPPLMAWTMAISAWLLSPVLALHDGAKFATAFYVLAAMAMVMMVARRWLQDGQAGALAPLILLVTFGMVRPAHMMIADVPLLAGFAIALAGLVMLGGQPRRGGALLGTGTGIGFLAKGMLAPGAIGLAVLVLIACSRAWRTRPVWRALAIAALFALPWFTIWPALLWWQSPPLFTEWIWDNNVGRFFGFTVERLGAAHRPSQWPQTLPWFTFPALPLAAWTVWTRRATIAGDTTLHACLALAGATLAVLLVSASGRDIYALPLLAPLAVLAVPALLALPRSVENTADWAARVFAGLLCAFAWSIWLFTAWKGHTPRLNLLAKHLPMDYPFVQIDALFFVAVILLASWLCLLPRLKTMRHRALVSWVAGIALVSGTAMTLLLPWIDAAKSYHIVYRELAAAIPAGTDCIASARMGESERSMLYYMQGIVTERVEIKPEVTCPIVLVHGIVRHSPRNWTRAGWKIIWTGARPGEHRERFWLLQRR
jgi:4-amino-4-deoxy-L-arabinose transferase-like glycosyltransferase